MVNKMKQDFLKDIAEYEVSKARLLQIKPEYVLYIKDRTIPLEERWNVFQHMPEFMKQSGGWVEYIPILEDSGIEWYDDFYIDRYQTVELNKIIERIKEELDDEYKGDLYEKIKDIPNLVDEIKEWVLENNIYSFINDW